MSSLSITKQRNSVQGLISRHCFNTKQDDKGFSHSLKDFTIFKSLAILSELFNNK